MLTTAKNALVWRKTWVIFDFLDSLRFEVL